MPHHDLTKLGPLQHLIAKWGDSRVFVEVYRRALAAAKRHHAISYTEGDSLKPFAIFVFHETRKALRELGWAPPCGAPHSKSAELNGFVLCDGYLKRDEHGAFCTVCGRRSDG